MYQENGITPSLLLYARGCKQNMLKNVLQSTAFYGQVHYAYYV